MTIYYIFSYVIFFYSLAIMLCYLALLLMSYRAQKKLHVSTPDDAHIKYALQGSPLAPAVSIIAPAFNEEVTIIDNVYSLMQIDYPDYEIIIVNDASTDRTLELLVEEFHLVEVPHVVSMRVPSRPIKRVFQSSDSRFRQLVVVDKEHGGRKSDGSNAGINVCRHKYFVCTDVDCIVEPMALYRMMWHVVESHVPVIGVGATMLMSNACTVDGGRVTKAAVSMRPLPMFQQLEYLRSFLIGKMGWSAIGALPNISGGFGLFSTDVVVKSGGYNPSSMAEDVDLLLRMVTYMKNHGLEFSLAQVPQVCCWTEGPSSLRAIYRQRVRWARGLFEIVSQHRKVFFNPHYGFIGAFTMPYIFMYEFLAPVLELGGVLFLIWLIFIGGVNWSTAFVIFGMIYVFAQLMTFSVFMFDYRTRAVEWYNRKASYLKLLLASILEPVFYHPLVTFCSNVGYFQFLRGQAAVWKPIQRRGVRRSKGNTPPQ
ncbi:MAG: glycosyltransferase family 2 protein [Alloprevotella sp.]|nr:glycosyltransferase family 2 protein [Alloprevotella sp.]